MSDLDAYRQTFNKSNSGRAAEFVEDVGTSQTNGPKQLITGICSGI
jgi:hypothetical protein